MNEIIQNAEQLFANIKADFSALWKHKLRGETLEIITPFSTLTGSFISIFLTQRDNRFIVTDGQRLFQILNELEIFNRRAQTYIEKTAMHYNVKKTISDQTHFYFKSTSDINLISAYIYDLAFFQSSVLNSIYSDVTFFDKEQEDQKFSKKANDVLQQKIAEYNKTSCFQFTLYRKHNLIQNAGFSSVLTKSDTNNLWAAMYITGSTPTIYCSTIYRANTGFMYVNDYDELRKYIRIAAVFDETASGNIGSNERVAFAKKMLAGFNPQVYTFEELKYKDLNDLCA